MTQKGARREPVDEGMLGVGVDGPGGCDGAGPAHEKAMPLDTFTASGVGAWKAEKCRPRRSFLGAGEADQEGRAIEVEDGDGERALLLGNGLNSSSLVALALHSSLFFSGCSSGSGSGSSS